MPIKVCTGRIAFLLMKYVLSHVCEKKKFSGWHAAQHPMLQHC